MLAVNLKKIRWQHRIQYLGNIFTFAQLRGVTAGQMSPFLHIPAQAREENSYGGHPMMQEIMRKITNATNILIRVPYSSKFRVLVQASSSSSSHSSISSSPFFSTVSINSWAELSTRAAMCLCSAWSCRWPSLYLYVRNRSDSSFNTIKTTHHYVFVSMCWLHVHYCDHWCYSGLLTNCFISQKHKALTSASAIQFSFFSSNSLNLASAATWSNESPFFCQHRSLQAHMPKPPKREDEAKNPQNRLAELRLLEASC